MYQNLLTAVKTRILAEVEDSFAYHPSYVGQVKILHKYPYEERIQMGVLLRNTSASMLRMSADNYLADSMSHVRLARSAGGNDVNGNPRPSGSPFPGLAIEWARENDFGITGYIVDENVSSQLGPTQRMFTTAHQIVSGQSNTTFADNIGQVKITLNGTEILPEFVDGEHKVVLLNRATNTSDVVKISYYYRTLSDPGIYVVSFIADNKFIVSPIYVIDKELVIENATGIETSVSLANGHIDSGTDFLYIESRNGPPTIELVRGTDYTLDLVTGVVTLLSTITKGYNLYADYRWQPTNYENGPYTVNPYQENHTAIPGAVLAIGRRAKQGDCQAIVIEKTRAPQARIYGGYWDMSMELAVIAKDPIQSAEMADHVISYLWGTRKNTLEFEGITLMSVEPSGESEEPFDDNSGDVYYITNVSVMLEVSWQEFVPYPFAIKRVIPNIHYTPAMPEFSVSKTNHLELIDFVPDMRKVIKYPDKGFEKVS